VVVTGKEGNKGKREKRKKEQLKAGFQRLENHGGGIKKEQFPCDDEQRTRKN